MVHLRPASVDDLPRMDELDAYYGASKHHRQGRVRRNAPSYTRG